MAGIFFKVVGGSAGGFWAPTYFMRNYIHYTKNYSILVASIGPIFSFLGLMASGIIGDYLEKR